MLDHEYRTFVSGDEIAASCTGQPPPSRSFQFAVHGIEAVLFRVEPTASTFQRRGQDVGSRRYSLSLAIGASLASVTRM